MDEVVLKNCLMGPWDASPRDRTELFHLLPMLVDGRGNFDFQEIIHEMTPALASKCKYQMQMPDKLIYQQTMPTYMPPSLR